MAGLLYMPPVLLAQWLGLAPEPLVVGYTICLGLIGTGFAAALAGRAGLLQRPDLFWPVAMLLFGCGWGEDFAQREHFAAILALPLVSVIGLRAAGQRPDWRCG